MLACGEMLKIPEFWLCVVPSRIMAGLVLPCGVSSVEYQDAACFFCFLLSLAL